MRATLHRAAKTGAPGRSRDVADGRRRAPRAAPRSGTHASRWTDDELATRAPRPRRLRAERRARRTPLGGGTRVGPSELYGYDAHGNIAFLTNPAGDVTDTYTYDAWGNLIKGTGATPNSRLYAGEEFDPDLGLINLRARQYVPGTGRFLSIDPLQTPSDSLDTARFSGRPFNRYLYAGLDPVTRVDPTGMVEAVEDEEFTVGETQVVIKNVHAAPHLAEIEASVEEINAEIKDIVTDVILNKNPGLADVSFYGIVSQYDVVFRAYFVTATWLSVGTYYRPPGW